MNFDIRSYIEFDQKGRAQCPACLQEGKTGKNLSVMKSGAYHCFRGCSPEQIRSALGAERISSPPPVTNVPPVKLTLLSPQKVKESTDRLLNQSINGIKWLAARGINSEMITHYRLGITRVKIGSRGKSAYLPAIAIPIPTGDGTNYFQKKRVAPWLPKEEQPEGYHPWSQYGIPAMTYTTHRPEAPHETWLCEGEWDAIVLGWAVRHSDLKNDVQVSCFTCGAGNIPPDLELEKLSGKVVTLYDLDEPGEKGANKIQEKLKGRCDVAVVPSPESAPKGWDISDAMSAGLFGEICRAARSGRPWAKSKPNPLSTRLISNDELLRRAPDYTDWLVEDILTADELFLLAASPRAGKSLLALTLTHAIATGSKFLGRPVAQGSVIYIRCEDSESKTKERELKQGWAEGLPVYWLDKFKLEELPHLAELIEDLNCRLVVFDTLSRIRDAATSESSAEMSQQLEPLQEMCKTHRCCALLVHHTGKISTDNAGTISVFDTIRGSSAIRATCRGALVLAADDKSYRLYVENGWGKLDLQILLDAHTLTWKLLGNWIAPNVDLNQKDRVLHFLTQVGKATIEEIATGTNISKRSLYEVLKRLQSDEIIEKHGDRQSAIYIRSSIQQITKLEGLLTKSDQEGGMPESLAQQGFQQFCNMSDTELSQQGSTTSESLTQQGFQQFCNMSDTESSQQIQQVDNLLNRSNPDRESISTLFNNFPESGSPPEKVSKNPKSAQNFAPFYPEAAPPTTGESVDLGPKALSGKDFGSQQQVNTESTRVSKWIFCIPFDTPVRLEKSGKRRSTVYVPGLGSRRFDNSDLRPIEPDLASPEGREDGTAN